MIISLVLTLYLANCLLAFPVFLAALRAAWRDLKGRDEITNADFVFLIFMSCLPVSLPCSIIIWLIHCGPKFDWPSKRNRWLNGPPK